MGFMGTAKRAMAYDSKGNKKAAIPALQFDKTDLSWFRADDGIMGGKSVTIHDIDEEGVLYFKGTLDTKGGGFTSVRAPVEAGTIKPGTKGIKVPRRWQDLPYHFG
jgi:hypothetical protein